MKTILYTLGLAVSALFMLLFAIGRGAASVGGISRITAEDASRIIRENAGNRNFMILDIRTPSEYRDGHIPGAVLLDFHAPEFRERLASLDRNKIYLMYCRSGNRSGRALELVSDLGFSRVYELRGGIRSWLSAGFTLR